MLELIAARCAAVPEPDPEAARQAALRLDELTKPPGSLGEWEPLIVRVAGMTGHPIPGMRQPGVAVFAADHGIAAAGVSAYGQEVTEEMAVNMCMGGAVSSVLARAAGARMRVVDVGVAARVRHPAAVVKKVAPGTRNFAQARAMTLEQAYASVLAGMEAVDELAAEGLDMLVIGEMGIGNTAAATALSAALLGRSAAEMTGPGTGLSAGGVARKIRLIEDALALHRPNPADPWDALSAVGGFEIGAMAGAILAAASRRIPVLLDGMITGAAAYLAARLCPRARAYLIASHASPEPAHALLLQALGLEPLVRWGMRLGEASGALLLLPALQNALRVMAETATFADAGVTNPHGREGAPEAGAAAGGEAGPGGVTGAAAATDAAAPPETAAMGGQPKLRPAGGLPAPNDFSPEERAALYKAIAARRDIRAYLPDEVPKDVLERILQAAHAAPSVGFMQPWNFILIRDQATLKEIHRAVDRERVAASVHYGDLRQDYYLRLKLEGLLQAPLTICVTNDTQRGGPHVLGRNTIPETDLMSTSCAIENMWLAARVEGVAMGWISIYRKDDLRRILGIPETVDPVALLTVGYTAYFPEIPALERAGWRRRLDLTRLIYQDRWQGEET